MSDQTVAAIARDLAKAMVARSKSWSVDDQKAVLALKTQLVQEISDEKKTDIPSLTLN